MPHQIQFGLFQPQVGLSFSILKERALAAEEYGFHSIWLPDHMWVRGLPQLDYLESWTVLSGLAGATTKIRLGGLVFCNSYRNPAFFARSRLSRTPPSTSMDAFLRCSKPLVCAARPE